MMVSSSRSIACSIAAVVLVCLLVGDASASSEECKQALKAMKTLAYPNTTYMRDATGTGSWGSTIYGSLDIGNFGECRWLEDRYATAHYCILIPYFNFSTNASAPLTAMPGNAICAPLVCTEQDLEENRLLVIQALQQPNTWLAAAKFKVICPVPETMPWSGWVVVGIVALLVVLVIIGSFIDYYLRVILSRELREDNRHDIPDTEMVSIRKQREQSTSLPTRLILAFSALNNYERLLAPAPPGTLMALNGIRVLAMAYVILGHTFSTFFVGGMRNTWHFLRDVEKTVGFNFVVGGFYAVDVFFWMSGFLVAYLFIKSLLKLKKVTPGVLGMYYFHRIARIFPAMAMCMFMFWLVLPYTNDGPYWAKIQEIIDDGCDSTWWRTLLFIQTWWPMMDTCAGHTWYLSVEMQLYVISPIFLLAYFYNKRLGWALTLGVIAVCIGINIGIVWHHEFWAFPGQQFFHEWQQSGKPELSIFAEGYQDMVYEKPYTRMGAYFVGFILAFFMIEQEKPKRIHFSIRGVCYFIVAPAVFVMLIISWTTRHWGWSFAFNVIFAGVHRSLFCALLSILLYVMYCGYGGMANQILSAAYWVPLARLSYGAYLYHVLLVFWYFGGVQFMQFYQQEYVLMLWPGFVVGAFFASFINYILLEKPLMNLEMMLMPKKQPPKPTLDAQYQSEYQQGYQHAQYANMPNEKQTLL